jgi:hypothetical protein
VTEEDVAELRRRAQNARDNAEAELLVADHFLPEYRKGLSGSPFANEQTYARSLQLYDFAIRSGHRARDFMQTAELFERIIDGQENRD